MHIRQLRTLALIVLAATASFAIADPSGRVGRIAYVQGDVSFLNNNNDESMAAQVNWPVTSQNLIATGRDGRTEIRVGSAAVRIDSDSELEVTQLDDQHFHLRLIYGSVYVRIRNPDMAKDFTLLTSQGRVLLNEPSRIRVDTERAPDTTSVSVLDGTANVAGAESAFTARAGKRAELARGDLRMTTLRPNDLQNDFDTWAAARDQRDEQSQAVRYVSHETTGYEELDRYGSWQTTSEYGAIWTPRTVASDWAPYRVGRWTWVEPWGWTWVDSAPWGYAPFHYGRWVWFHQRWCWTPGAVVARPVWAPAMVGWVGGANWNVAFSAGAAPAVGWFPLAPREVYVPSYRVSPAYIRQVNVTHVTNINNVTVVNGYANAPQNTHYQNREVQNAVSLMPHDQFVARRTVVVANNHERNNSRAALQSAPMSAVMPASIAHPHGFAHQRERERQHERDHDTGRASNDTPRPTFSQGQPNRTIQPVQPVLRESAPPTDRWPAKQDREERRVMRNSDVQIERRIAPAIPTTTPPAAQPTVPAPTSPTTNGTTGFSRRHEIHTDRHIEPPNVFNPAREAPRVVTQPNQAQESALTRREHDAQQQTARAQARALQEQRLLQQPATAPLKQTAPLDPHTLQDEHVRHRPEKTPAEIPREGNSDSRERRR